MTDTLYFAPLRWTFRLEVDAVEREVGDDCSVMLNPKGVR